MTDTITSCIPRDIIREILSHLRSILPIHNPRTFPWYLGHICAAWRAEFLPLCDTIDFIDRISFRPLSAERGLNILQWFLDHDSNIPFSFTFHTQHCFTIDNKDRALDMLCKQSHRWKDVTLSISEEEVGILSQVKNRVPLLQTLILVSEDIAFEIDSNTFINAPVLSKLGFYTNAPWKFPWASLTSLSFDLTISYNTILDVLFETTNLNKLTISGLDNREIVIPDTQIILPYLAHLNISDAATSILGILMAPALVRLYLDPQGYEDVSIIVGSFIHRSGCQLQHVQFSGQSIFDLMELVDYTPDLEHLHVINVDFPLLLEYLIGSDSQAMPLCHLKSLTLEYLTVSEELHRQLCTLIKSRSTKVEANGEMLVERLRTLVIARRDKEKKWEFGTVLRKFCEEHGVSFQEATLESLLQPF